MVQHVNTSTDKTSASGESVSVCVRRAFLQQFARRANKTRKLQVFLHLKFHFNNFPKLDYKKNSIEKTVNFFYRFNLPYKCYTWNSSPANTSLLHPCMTICNYEYYKRSVFNLVVYHFAEEQIAVCSKNQRGFSFGNNLEYNTRS